MKTNLKKLGSMVMVVGMMSTCSLTAFAAESIPAAKLTAATPAVKTTDSIPMTKIVDIKDGVASIPMTLIGNLQAVSGYTVKTLADGSWELVNKETGDTVKAVKAVKITQTATSSIKK